MNTYPPQPPASLDAEERTLAARLPRVPGRSEPGPDLDASILAAGRAALESPGPAAGSSFPRRTRWFAPLSLAASLLLALGLAWRMQPLPASYRYEAKRSAPPVPPASTGQRAAPAAYAHEPAMATPLPPLESTPSPSAPQALPAPSSAPVPAPSSNAAASDGELANPEPQAFRPAPETPPAMATPPASLPAPNITAQAAAAAPVIRNEAGMAAEAISADAPEDSIPPATVDTPQVRDAWLERIRQLLDRGERDAARESLAEFRRRYPDAALPSALHELDLDPAR